ncbi:hypothetical protein BH20ACI4_BH20ACI4_15430 [soil metagenome]
MKFMLIAEIQRKRLPVVIDNLHKKIAVARFALSSSVLPLATDAMPFAEMTRFAVSHNRAGNSFSRALIGKEWNADLQKWLPLKGHEHAHFFATDEDGDGRLDHLTVFAPCGFNADDLEALGQIHSVKRPKNLPSTKLVLTGLGNKVDFPAIPIFGKSKIWRSVTPFSLPNFPNRGGGKPPRPKDLPEAQLLKELKSRNLPAPVRIKRSDGYQTEKRPPMRWLEFYDQRLRKETHGKGLYGFEIEFETEVEGPIAVGFGCHFGLGLFLPVRF